MPRRASYAALLFLLAVLIASAAMPASASINLLQNPGFEEREDGAPWDIFGNGEWDGGLGTPGHTGTRYAWIDTDDGEAWVRQDIDPPRCAEYLEFYYLGQAGEEAIWVGVYYSDGTEHSEGLPNRPADPWGFIHVDLDTTKLVEAVETRTGLGGELYVDDFDLEACPAVGGVVMPANTLALVAPWLAVIGLVGCISTVVVVAKKRR